MKKIFTFLLPIALLYSCASIKSLNKNDFSGLYQGITPCADCVGIKTSIDIKPDLTYQKTNIYLEKEVYLKQNGSWKIKNDSTILLNENGQENAYRTRNGNLIILDGDGNIITGDIAPLFILHKVDTTENAEGDYSALKKRKIDFFATGNEPFWSLEYTVNKSLKFSLFGENKPVVLQSLLLTYKDGMTIIKDRTKKSTLEVLIYDFPCVNDMSGQISSYYVEVKENDKIYKGCGSEIQDNFELAGNWNLTFIKDFSIPKNKSGKEPFINFDIQDKMLNGNLGCNNFGAQYQISGNKITFSKMFSTLMACQDMETENKFSSVIEEINNYKVVNNVLQFYKDNDLILTFKR
jgi:heat shock protein HslJ/uncharacterized membrane protein